MKALQEFLRPEFIGRVDEIITFHPLSEENLEKITALMLDEYKPGLAPTVSRCTTASLRWRTS